MILGKKTLIANNNSSKAFYFSSSPLGPLLLHSAAVFRQTEGLLCSALSLVSCPVPPSPLHLFSFTVPCFFPSCLSWCQRTFYLCSTHSLLKNNQQAFTELISDHYFYVWYRIWSVSLSEQGRLAVSKGEFNLFLQKLEYCRVLCCSDAAASWTRRIHNDRNICLIRAE